MLSRLAKRQGDPIEKASTAYVPVRQVCGKAAVVDVRKVEQKLPQRAALNDLYEAGGGCGAYVRCCIERRIHVEAVALAVSPAWVLVEAEAVAKRSKVSN